MWLKLALLVALSAAQPPFYTDKSDLLYYLRPDGGRRVVNNERDWLVRRSHIVANMQLVMGPLPEKSAAPLDVVVEEEVQLEGYLRRKLTFVAEGDDRVSAYLLLPLRPHPKRPAMLCLHQTTRLGKAEPAGMGPKTNLHYARELAQRGYVTLAPDYPNFGDYQVDPYSMGYASASMKGVVNHRRAVDLLASLPQVDPARIGVIGHSLGGHNALFLAVFEPRLRAVVTSCGFTSFGKYYGGNLAGWSHKGYMPRIADAYGKSPDRMPFDFPEVLGAIAPRPVFVNAPRNDSNFEVSGVEDCLRSARLLYQKVYRSAARLVAAYPETGHDFPSEVREQAYTFLDNWLRDQ